MESIEVMRAQMALQLANQLETENLRHTNQMAVEARRNRLEVIRMAKETLIENARNKPVEESAVSAADITTFAQELTSYVGE
jgi:hypothetical protein